MHLKKRVKNRLLIVILVLTISFFIQSPSSHAEATQDFNIQRVDVTNLGAAGDTLDVALPTPVQNISRAFARITNTAKISGGPIGNTSNQDIQNLGVIISLINTTHFRLTRHANSDAQNQGVYVEIIEYIGQAGGPNEFIVRGRGTISQTGAGYNTAAVSGVADVDKVVPFLTGIYASTTGMVFDDLTAVIRMQDASNVAINRTSTGGTATASYAVVEFTGYNWLIGHTRFEFTDVNTATISIYKEAIAGSTVLDIQNWSNAFIEHSYRSTNGQVGIEEHNCRVWPGINTNEIRVDMEAAADNVGLGGYFVQAHIISNPELVVEHLTPAEGAPDNNFNTTVTAVSALNQTSVHASLTSTGGGTAYNRGVRNYKLSGLSSVAWWGHRTGNVLSITLAVAQWPKDYPPPNITALNNPSDNLNTTLSTFDFNFTVVGERTLANCSLWADWNGTWALNDTLPNPANGSVNTIQVSGIPLGTHTWNVQCFDSAGKSDWYGQNYTLIIRDTGPPDVTALNYPGDNDNLSTNLVDFNFTVVAEATLANCSLWGNWSGGWSLKDTLYTPANGSVNTIQVADMPPGTFIWNVQCFDSPGKSDWYMQNYTVTIKESPTIAVISPPNNFSTQDTNITFSYNVSGTLPLVNCSLYINSTLNQTNTSVNYSTTESFFVNFSSAGVYPWNIKCVNNQDGVGQTASRTVAIASPPTSAINEPPNGTYTKDTTPAINITLSDASDSVLNYTVYVDGGVNKQGTASNGVKTAVVLNTLSLGSHEIIVEALNDAGLSTNSTPITLTVDNTNPTVTLISPSDTETVFGSTVVFTFKFTDSYSPNATCDLTINSAVNKTGISALNNTNTQWAVYNFAAASYTWSVNCTDAAGNGGTSTTYSFDIDLTPQGLGFGEDIPVPANGYSEGSAELFRMCTDAACSSAGTNFVSTDTVYMQMIGADDLGNGKKNKFYVYNGTSPTILRTGSWTCGGGGGTDGTYDTCNVSFILSGLSDGWYYIESDLEDDLGAGIKHRDFTTFTIGATQPVSGYHFKLFNDASYSREDDTFYNNDEVYVEIITLPNNTLDTTQTGIDLRDFHKNKIDTFDGSETYDRTASPYRFHFTMTNSPTAGYWYFFDITLEDTNIKLGPEFFGRMMIYEQNYQPNVTLVTQDPDPAIEGQNMTFSVAFTDQNIANRHIMRVCNSSSRTGTSCTDTELCSSADYLLPTTVNTPRTCKYPINRSTPENNTAYVFVCDQKDSCSTMYQMDWNVQKDHIKPSINLNYPSDNSWFNYQNHVFNYTPTDAGGIANCSIYLDGALNQTNTTITNNSINQFTINNIQQGTHTWYVNCTDNSSMYNINSSAARTFYVDLTDPTVSITYPSNNSYTSDLTPPFNFTPIDNMDGTLAYKVYVGGAFNGQQGTAANSTNKQVSVDLLSQGVKTVFFQIIDEAANYVNSTIFTITVDTGEPTISIEFPINFFNSSSTTILYNYSLSDTYSPNATCELDVNGALNRTDYVNMSQYFSFSIVYAEGYHNWNLSCTDTAGNKKSEQVYNLTVDLTSPIVNLESPQNNTLNTTSNNIDFKFNTTDAITSIINCSLVIDDNVSLPIITPVTEGQTTAALRSLSNGQYFWYVNCTDTVGRVGKSDVYNLSINVTTDLDPPVVVLNNPIDNYYLSNSTIDFFYTATDALSNISNCSLYINNALNITNNSVPNGIESNFTLINMQDNDYNWSVGCVDDGSGNNDIGFSENRTFTIDTTDPSAFSLTSPANDTYSTSISPTLQWGITTEINFKNYTIQLSDTSDFSYVNQTYYTTANTTTSVAASGLDSNSIYYWRVIAYDKAGNSRISTQTRTYITDNTLPLAFEITSPSNDTYSTDRTPLLQWGQGNDTNFKNYTVLVSTSPTFSSINYQYNTYTQTGNSYQVIVPWTDNTLFYWKVIAYDKANNQRNSSVYKYTTDNIYPASFTLTSPANDTYSPSTSPTLQWEETTETNLDNYTIQLSTSETFSYINLSFYTYLTNATTKSTSGLVQNTKYYWRVIAYDKAGQSTTSTDYFIYGTDNTNPSLYLESPADNYSSSQSLVNFYYNVSDTNDIVNCTLIIDDSIEDTETSITKDTSQSLSAVLTNGQHNWSINCSDNAGNIGATQTRNITVNVVIPTHRWNETSTSSCTDTLCSISLGAADGTENQVFYSITGPTLVQIVSAASSQVGANGLLIPSTASISFKGEFMATQDRSFVTWFLDYYNGTDYTRVCQAGYNESGGTLIWDKDVELTLSDSCNPSSGIRIESTDTLRLGINIYNSESGKTEDHWHYWDNTRTSYVDVEAYILGFMNVNLSSPLADPQPAENTDFNASCNVTCNQGLCMNTTLTIQYNTSSQSWTDIGSSGSIKLAFGETNDKSLGDINTTVQKVNFSLTANTPSVNNIRCAATSSYSSENGSVTTQITVRDVTPPTVILGNPANDTWFNYDNVTYYFTPNDNVNISNCSVIASGSIIGTKSQITLGAQNNISAVTSNGHHNWSVNCTDPSGNTGSSSEKLIHVDTVFPTAAITTPQNNTFTKDTTPEITFNSTDNLDSVLNYTIYVDSSPNGQAGTVSNSTLKSLNITALSEGYRYIKILVEDQAANQNFSDEITLIIDLSNPSITVFNPSTDYKTANNYVIFNYSISDALSPNSTCNLTINSGLNSTDTLINNTPFSTQINFGEGYHNWSLSCSDLATNNDFTPTKNITIDLSSPTVQLNGTPPNDYYENNSNTITFFFNTTDTITDVESCSFVLNDSVNGLNKTSPAENQLINFTRTISNGAYTWYINCTDTVGRTGKSLERNITVNVTIDLEAPEIILEYPISSEFSNTSNIVFLYTPTDALSNVANCSLYINDTLNYTETNITNSVQNNFTVNQVSDGIYSWYVNCTDTSSNNNYGPSTTETFNIDTVLPTAFNLTAPANATFTENNSPTMTWTQTTDNNFLNYTVQFSTSSTFASIALSYSTNTSTNTSITASLSNNTKYYWRVIAYDKAKNSRVATQVFEYTIDTIYPASFALTTPTNNTYSYNTTPLLSWSTTTETNFKNYTIQIAEDQNFSTIDFEYYTYSITQTNYSVSSPLSNNTKYYWRVIAYDKVGHQTVSTDYFTYNLDNTLPLTFNLQTPADNTYSQDTTPLLTWQDAYDLNFKNYTIRVSTDQNFSYTNYTYSTSPFTNVSYQVAAPWTDNTAFYWKITAYDKAGNSRDSTIIFTYTIDNINPVLNIEGPVDGYNSTESIITFSYNVSDTNPINNCSLIVDGSISHTSDVVFKDITQTIDEPIPNGINNWSINCTDNAGNTINSSTRLVNQTVDIPLFRYNETSDRDYSSTGDLNLGAKDVIENKVTRTIGAQSLYTMATATSLDIGGNGMVIMPQTILSFSGVFEATFADDGYITWKLYKQNGTDNLICQAGDDSTGGEQITQTSKSTYTNTCTSPNENYFIGPTDNFKLTVNIYNSRTASQSFKHYFDGPSNSYVEINAYNIGNKTTLMAEPAQNLSLNETETFNATCNVSCSSGTCINVKSYVQINTTGGGWQDIGYTGNIILNGSDTNGKSAGMVADSATKSLNFTLYSNQITSNKIRCQARSDHTGHVNSSEIDVDIYDHTPPIINLDLPITNFNTTNTTINFSWTQIENYYPNANCTLTVNSQTYDSSIINNNTLKTSEIQSISTGYVYWNVTCHDARNNTATSTTRNFTILDAPQTLNVSLAVDNSSLDLSWEPVEGATSYNIYIKTAYADNFSDAPNITGLTDTNWTDSNPNSSTVKYYKIAPVRGNLEKKEGIDYLGKKSVTLQGGTWQLVNFPFGVTKNRLGNKTIYGDPISVSPAGAIKSIYRLNTTSQIWESVNYKTWGWEQSIGSEEFLQLDKGQGYWFEMNNNATIYYMGEVIENPEFNISLKSGWNLVGPVFNEVTLLPACCNSTETYPFTMNPVDNMYDLYEYDASSQSFLSNFVTFFDGSGWFDVADIANVKPNTGYYLDMNINTTWLVGR